MTLAPGMRVRRLDGVWTVYRVTPCAAYIRRGEARRVEIPARMVRRGGAIVEEPARSFEAEATQSLSVSIQCPDCALVGEGED